MTCCICYTLWDEDDYVQLHTCSESKSCFYCLATWGINEEDSRNHVKNIEDWWKDVKCPVCNKELENVKENDPKKWEKFFLYMKSAHDVLGCSMEETIRRTYADDLHKRVKKLEDRNALLEAQWEYEREGTNDLRKKLDDERKERKKQERLAWELQKRLLEETTKNKLLEEKNKKRKNIINEAKKKSYDLMYSLLDHDIDKVAKKAKREIGEDSPFDLSLGFPTLNELFTAEKMENL